MNEYEVVLIGLDWMFVIESDWQHCGVNNYERSSSTSNVSLCFATQDRYHLSWNTQRKLENIGVT